MEDSMMLHNHLEIFKSIIKETSDNLKTRDFFIEKDYWISLVLKRLSESKFADSVVFKGGTSLSKGFKLINRFSEDVDIAVIDVTDITGNQLKTLIRTVEKEIARDLQEIEVQQITSKGSRFRKSVYKYPKTYKSRAITDISNTLIVEINSFANPFPYSKASMQSLIGEYLQNNNQFGLIKKYGLGAFEVNVLDLNQTLVEKLISLVRFSFDENVVESLSSKIRHFYDLYYLANHPDCAVYINTAQFRKDFSATLEHDKKTFDEPTGWNSKELSDSPLIADFDNLWSSLKQTYSKELVMLSFTEIPGEQDVSKSFQNILSILTIIES